MLEKFATVKKLRELARNKEFLCKELAKENKEMMDVIKSDKGEKKNFTSSPTYMYKEKYKEKCKEIASLKKKIKKYESLTKSLSPFGNPTKESSSPPSKKNLVNNLRKKSPVRVQIKAHKSLYRTQQTLLSKL